MSRLTARSGILVAAVLVAAVLLGAVSCGPGGDSGSGSPSTPSPEGSSSMSTSTGRPGPTGHSVRAQALSDLAERLAVPESTIEVVTEEEVTWRDGSLGCAERGMAYTQALVDGTRIVLEVDGTRYSYHSGRSAPPFLCANPTE